MGTSGKNQGEERNPAGKGPEEPLRPVLPAGDGVPGGRGPARMPRLAWVLAILLLVPALWGLVPVFERSPLFEVREIHVEGCERMTPEAVRALLREVEGTSLIALSSARISRGLESRVPIQNASVIKRFPNGLLVRIRERTPVARVEIGDTWCALDGQGVVLYPVRPEDGSDLPVITGLKDRAWVFGRPDRGPRVQSALGLLRALEHSRLPGKVSRIHADPDQGMSFFLEGFAAEIRAGWEAFPSRLDLLAEALPALARAPQAACSVDLRFRDQIVVRKGAPGEEPVSPQDPVTVGGGRGARKVGKRGDGAPRV